MKVTIEPTPEIYREAAIPLRVWTGTTDRGSKVDVYVYAITPQAGEPAIDDEIPDFMQRARDFHHLDEPPT